MKTAKATPGALFHATNGAQAVVFRGTMSHPANAGANIKNTNLNV
jgi:hypothetical protein